MKSSLPSTRSSPSRSSVPSRPQSSWRAQGDPGRIHDLLMEIQLTKVRWGGAGRGAAWAGGNLFPSSLALGSVWRQPEETGRSRMCISGEEGKEEKERRGEREKKERRERKRREYIREEQRGERRERKKSKRRKDRKKRTEKRGERRKESKKKERREKEKREEERSKSLEADIQRGNGATLDISGKQVQAVAKILNFYHGTRRRLKAVKRDKTHLTNSSLSDINSKDNGGRNQPVYIARMMSVTLPPFPLCSQVSFQHESYSGGASEKLSLESEEQPLARQVFVVQELEIRDRLASSQINKFLYLYSSELLPRRAHSNMVRTGSPIEAGAFSGGNWTFLFLLLKTFRLSSQKFFICDWRVYLCLQGHLSGANSSCSLQFFFWKYIPIPTPFQGCFQRKNCRPQEPGAPLR
ncbi:Autophagy-related protein 2-like A, partial [Ophiophagus hannah]